MIFAFASHPCRLLLKQVFLYCGFIFVSLDRVISRHARFGSSQHVVQTWADLVPSMTSWPRLWWHDWSQRARVTEFRSRMPSAHHRLPNLGDVLLNLLQNVTKIYNEDDKDIELFMHRLRSNIIYIETHTVREHIIDRGIKWLINLKCYPRWLNRI